ncbi:MAG TPA: ammonium transporter [Acidimicrobiia bacterium]|jgi:Amt family ammonium transporter|nr:ammonium transporter [Acidimicrobiia bacterium]HIL04869.1 ammonium transporter [Acidimicrobiia bacterium]
MKRKLLIAAAGVVGGLFLFAGPVSADGHDGDAAAMAVQAVMDNLWVFIAGVLVFLMQAGFAMLESGLTRSKNVGNIMAKNLADAAIGIMAFFLVGYGLAYGSDSGSSDLFGWGSFALSGVDLFDMSEGLSGATDFFFQAVFAATAVTIASGALAERTKFSAYLIFSLLTTAIIYPIVVHWTWGGGLIAQITIGDAVYSDFAGSTIVHSVGGWLALIGAFMVGPRIGKYGPDGSVRTIPGHNITLAILGVFILWFGWFGFNPGSELAADNWVMFVALNTVLAACAGVIGAAAFNWLRTGKPDVAVAGNGALGGLVGITAGCGTMTPWGSVLTGVIAGFVVVLAANFVDRKLKIDDAVGAFAVHGACGIWGTLAIGLFAKYDDAFLGRDDAGLFYGGGLDQLAMQAVMVLIVAAWTLVTGFIMFGGLKYIMGLRVSPQEETVGLDVSEHGGPGLVLDDVVTRETHYS